VKVTFLVYGVLYVAVEIAGHELSQVSWPQVTALDVATASADALLTVAVLVALLVAVDLLGHRWRRHLQAVALEEARAAAQDWAQPAPITVRAWRPEPLALAAAPRQAPRAAGRTTSGAVTEDDYVDSGYARQAWSEDTAADAPGRLL